MEFFLIIRIFNTNSDSSARNPEISKIWRGRCGSCRSARPVPKSRGRLDPRRRMHACSRAQAGPHISALLAPIGTAHADLGQDIPPRQLLPFFFLLPPVAAKSFELRSSPHEYTAHFGPKNKCEKVRLLENKRGGQGHQGSVHAVVFGGFVLKRGGGGFEAMEANNGG